MYQGCKLTDTNVLFNISIVNIGKTRAEALVAMPNSQQMSNLGGTVRLPVDFKKGSKILRE